MTSIALTDEVRSRNGLYFRLVLTLLVVWIAGGAACGRQQRVQDFQRPPIVFDQPPTLEELVQSVNRTNAVRELQSNAATIKAPLMSDRALNATLVLRRDTQFRLKGKLSPLPQTLVDLGSNEHVFWLRVPEGMQQVLYYADHEEYARQSQRMILPVNPTWLMDALGLAQIHLDEVTEGPTRRPDGQLEIRCQKTMPDGEYRMVYVIADRTGVVSEQYVYGPSGQLVARAIASDHRYYESAQCSIPHAIRIDLQPIAGPPLALEVKIGQYSVNQILSNDPLLFAMPEGAGEKINLVQQSRVPPPSPQMPDAPQVTDLPHFPPGTDSSPAYDGPQASEPALPGGLDRQAEPNSTPLPEYFMQNLQRHLDSVPDLEAAHDFSEHPVQPARIAAEYAAEESHGPTLRGTLQR